MSITEAADANIATHCAWAMRAVPGSLVQDDPDLLLVDSGLATDTFNLVCRGRLDPARAEARIAGVLNHFREAGRSFSWWVTSHDRPGDLGQRLMRAGLAHAESETGMSIEIGRMRMPDLAPGGLAISRVRTPADMEGFIRVMGDAGAEPDVLRFYRTTAPALVSRESPQWFYVGYVESRPVATSELTLAAGVAGIYSVVTLEEFRRRGIGSALTAQPLIDARQQGITTAVLQASGAGESVYRGLGFTAFGEVNEYKPVRL